MSLILYVAGYGRSGSTILDIRLGERFGFVSLGELCSLYAELSLYEAARCGCGKVYSECPLWSEVAHDPEVVKRRCLLRVYQAPVFLAPFLWCWYLLRYGLVLRRQEFLVAVQRPLDRVERQYPGGVFVDSSKTAWFCARRPDALAVLGHRVAVLHLKRPLRDVLASVRAGDNKVLGGDRKQEKFLRVPRALVSYWFANLSASGLRHRYPYLELSQVELRDNEDAVMERVYRFVSDHLGPGYARYFESHVVSGNRLKLTRARAAPARPVDA